MFKNIVSTVFKFSNLYGYINIVFSKKISKGKSKGTDYSYNIYSHHPNAEIML